MTDPTLPEGFDPIGSPGPELPEGFDPMGSPDLPAGFDPVTGPGEPADVELVPLVGPGSYPDEPEPPPEDPYRFLVGYTPEGELEDQPEERPFPEAEIQFETLTGPAAPRVEQPSPEQLDAHAAFMLSKMTPDNPGIAADAAGIKELTGMSYPWLLKNAAQIRAGWERSQRDPAKWRRDNSVIFETIRAMPHAAFLMSKEKLSGPVRAFRLYNALSDLAGVYGIGVSPLGGIWDAATDIHALATGTTPEELKAERKIEREAAIAEVGKAPRPRTVRTQKSPLRGPAAMVDRFVRTRAGFEMGEKGFSQILLDMKARYRGTPQDYREADLNRQDIGLLREQAGEAQIDYDSSELGLIGLDFAQAAASGVESVPALLIGGGVGYFAGPKAGATAAQSMIAVTTFPIEAGSAYLEFERMGVDPELAGVGALLYGIVATGIETGAIIPQMRAFSGLSDAVRAGGPRAWMRSALKDPAKVAALKVLGRGLANNIGAQMGEEVSQGSSQDLIGWITLSITKGRFMPFDFKAAREHRQTEAYMAALGAAGGPAVMPQLAIGIMHAAAEARGVKVVETVHATASQPEAQQAPSVVSALQERATGSTSVWVDPQAFADEATAHGADPMEAAREIMGDSGPDRLKQALASRDDSYGLRATLEVPHSEYNAKWGDKEIAKTLLQDTASRWGEPTSRDQEGRNEELRSMARRLAAEVQGEEGPDVSLEEKAYTKAAIREMVETGRLGEKDARTTVAITRAFIRTNLARSPAAAAEVFAHETIKFLRASEADLVQRALTARHQALTPAEQLGERYRDRNTGLLNEAGRELAVRDPARPGVARFDFEYQKQLNDEMGHKAFDGILRTAARLTETRDAAKVGGSLEVDVVDQAQADELAATMAEATGVRVVATAVPRAETTKETGTALGIAHDARRAKLVAAGEYTGREVELPPEIAALGPQLTQAALGDAPTQADLAQSHGEALAALGEAEALYETYHEGSGLLNELGFERGIEVTKPAFVASADARMIKLMNEVLGRPNTDGVMALLSETLADLSDEISLAHLHGDEFGGFSDDKEKLEAFLSEVEAQTQSWIIIGQHPKTGAWVVLDGVWLAHGIAENFDKADRVELRGAKLAQKPTAPQLFNTGDSRADNRAALARAREISAASDGRRVVRLSKVLERLDTRRSLPASRQAEIRLLSQATAADLANASSPEATTAANVTARRVYPKPKLRNQGDAYAAAMQSLPDGLSPSEKADSEFAKSERGEIARPGPYEGRDARRGEHVGLFDAVDGHLDLTKNQKVSSGREAFKLLMRDAEGTREQKAMAAAEFMAAEVPGYEAMVLPDEFIDAAIEEETRARELEYWEDREREAGVTSTMYQPAFHGTATRDIQKTFYQPSAAQAPLVDTFEDEHRDADNETALVVGKDGTELARILGEEGYVQVTEDALTAMATDRGSLFSHNHPRDSVFSAEDIHMAVVRDLSELRATTRTGAWVVTRPPDGWMGPDHNLAELTIDERAKAVGLILPAFAHGASNANARMDKAIIAAGDFPGDTNSSAYSEENWLRYFNEEIEKAVNEAIDTAGWGWKIEFEPLADRDARQGLAAKVRRPAATTTEQLATESPEFKTWFGDSRVVDEEGQPLVVYHPKSPNILEQPERPDSKAPRGFVEIKEFVELGKEGIKKVFSVFLAPGSDRSTVLHESAHIYLEMLGTMAEHPEVDQRLRDDYALILEELGAATTADITEKMHEVWARSFEQYLMTGKAPSLKLAEAFHTFRMWLIEIYRTLAGLKVDVSPELRGVFDRMLATEGEIAHAKMAAGLDDATATELEAAMTPEDRAKHQKLRLRSATSTGIKLLRSFAEAEERAVKAFATAEFKKLARVAKAEWDARPDAQAFRFVKTGKMISPVDGRLLTDKVMSKLDSAEVVAILGKAHLLVESLGRRLVKKDGRHPAEIADMFGFETGREMLEALAAMPDSTEWVQERAEEMMRERHPEIEGELANIQEKIQRIQHTDEDAREALMLEIETAGRRTGFGPQTASRAGVIAQDQAAQSAAREIVRQSSAGRIARGGMLRKAEALAAQATLESAKGNWARVRELRRQQLTVWHTYQELDRAFLERKQFSSLISKMGNKRRRETMGAAGMGLLGVADQIMEAIGAKEVEELEEPRESIGTVFERLTNDGEGPAFSVVELEELVANPPEGGWTGGTIEQMRLVHKALAQLYTLARSVTAVMDGDHRVQIEHVNDAYALEVSHRKDLGPTGDPQVVRSVQAELLGPQEQFRKMGDTVYRIIWGGRQKARAAKDELTREVGDFWAKAWLELPKELQERRFDDMKDLDGVAIPADVGRAVVQDRQFLWMVVLYMGAGSNRDRLLGGYKWDETEVLDWIKRNLTRDEAKFIEQVWAINDDVLYPRMEEAYTKHKGLAPNKLEPATIKTKWGELAGGYMAAKYDPIVSRLGQAQQRSAVDNYSRNAAAISVAASFTKERAKKYSDVIMLDWNVIPAHVSGVIHYVAYNEYVRGAKALLLSPRFKQTTQRRFGEETHVRIAGDPDLGWLAMVASPHSDSTPTSVGMIAKGLGLTRKALVASAVCWAPLIAANAVSEPFEAAASAMGPKLLPTVKSYGSYLVSSARAYAVTESKVRERALRLGAFVRHREGEAQKLLDEMQEVGRQAGEHAFWTARRTVSETGWWFFIHFDNMSTTIIWDAAFTNAIAAGMSEKDAAFKADDTTESVMTPIDREDMSAILRDRRSMSMILLFHGYYSKRYSMVSATLDDAMVDVENAEGVIGKAGAIASPLMAKRVGQVMAMLAFSQLVGNLIMGHGPEPDETYGEWVTHTMMASPLLVFPFVGPLAEFGSQKLTAAVSGRKLPWFKATLNPRGSPLSSVAQRLSRAAGRALDSDRETGDRVWDMLEIAGILSMTPTGSSAVVKAGRYLTSVAGGYAGDTSPLGVAKGVLVGERVTER